MKKYKTNLKIKALNPMVTTIIKTDFFGCCYCSEEIRLLNMLFLVFIFFLVELIIGQMTNSISLTTDSFHMLSDALALLIGLFTVIVSQTN